MEENQKVKVFFGILKLEEKHYNRLIYMVALGCSIAVGYLFTTSYIKANEKMMDMLFEENKSLKEENRQLYRENNSVYKLINGSLHEDDTDKTENPK